jgi:hypothetical protein
VIGPASGSLTLNTDGSFKYTPNPSTIEDSFVYRICEDLGGPNELCGPATVTIFVAVVNSPPVAFDDIYARSLDAPLTVAAPGVLANDVDDDALTAALVTDVTNGTLVLNSDGSFTYSAPPGFTGVVSFTYVANDGVANSNQATVTIVVLEVTSATYRERQDRWQVEGVVSVPNSVDVYLNSVAPENLIGAASVDEISGDWSLNVRGSPVVPVTGDTVIAVSSEGVLTDPVEVVLRN